MLNIPLPSPESHDVERPLTAHAPFDRVEEELGAAAGELEDSREAGGPCCGASVSASACACASAAAAVGYGSGSGRSPHDAITDHRTRSPGLGGQGQRLHGSYERTREQKGLRCGNGGGCRGARNPCDRRPQQLSSRICSGGKGRGGFSLPGKGGDGEVSFLPRARRRE